MLILLVLLFSLVLMLVLLFCDNCVMFSSSRSLANTGVVRMRAGVRMRNVNISFFTPLILYTRVKRQTSFLVGLASGYYFGYDHGFERAAKILVK